MDEEEMNEIVRMEQARIVEDRQKRLKNFSKKLNDYFKKNKQEYGVMLKREIYNNMMEYADIVREDVPEITLGRIQGAISDMIERNFQNPYHNERVIRDRDINVPNQEKQTNMDADEVPNMEGTGITRSILNTLSKTIYKPQGWTKPDVSVPYPRHMPPKSILIKMAEASYSKIPPKVIGGFTLVYSTPTLCFYRRTPFKDAPTAKGAGEMVVAIRGTADARDVRSWYNIANGTLNTSARAKEDEAVIRKIKSEYPMDYYVGVGHSAGGSFLDLFIAKGYLKEGVSYNPSVERQYYNSSKNYRIYMANDPLYNLIGKYSKIGEVRGQPKVSRDDALGAVQSVKSHLLSNFRGGADVNQKGSAAEMRTWIIYLINQGIIPRNKMPLYSSLNDTIHSNDVNVDNTNTHIDRTNSYDVLVQRDLDEAKRILTKSHILPAPSTTPVSYPSTWIPPPINKSKPDAKLQTRPTVLDRRPPPPPAPAPPATPVPTLKASAPAFVPMPPRQVTPPPVLAPAPAKGVEGVKPLDEELPFRVVKKKKKGKGAEPSYTMPVSELVDEHQQLVHILKNGTPDEKKREIKRQTAELKKYEKMAVEGSSGGKMTSAKIAIAKKIRDYTDEQVEKDFKSLEELPCDDSIQKSLAGLKLVDRATFAERLDVVGKTNRNYYDILEDKEELLKKRYIKNLYEYTKKKSPNASEEKIWFGIKNVYFNSVNAFKPSISKYLFCKFGAKHILDFSAGWGGRLIGAMAVPDTTYIGIDTNTDLKRGYKYLIDTLDVKDRVKMIWSDSSKVDYSKLKYDFVFTSPPYFTLEKYEGMPEYKTVVEFNEKFWFPVLTKVMNGLDVGGKILLNIPKPMYEDTKKILGTADKLIPLYKVKRGRVGKSKVEEYEEYIYLWNKKQTVSD
jgi:hypothetical protein